MTKGIFALVPIGTAIAGHAFFTHQFKQLFRWRWAVAAMLTGIFVLPEVYAVYVQFDRHPEKIVFNRTGVSGVKWFLWDSQFSRFIMQGPIVRAKGDLFYYVHTLLWAFAPWCLLLYYVFARRVFALIKRKKLPEYITISAIIPMLLFFSVSKFQLNFYTNILFPFFSILVASLIAGPLSKSQKLIYSITQIIYSIVFTVGAFVIIFLLKPQHQWLYVLTATLLTVSAFIIFFKAPSVNARWLVISCLPILFVNFCLNFSLYPKMSALKGENQAAAIVNQFYGDQKLGVFENRRSGFEFYSKQPAQQIDIDQWAGGKERDRIFYVDEAVYPSVISKNVPFTILKEFDDHTSENVIKFLRSTGSNPTVHHSYLIRSK
jgi:hypothetical protein